MTATQAPTPGPLSVGDRVVAIADLRQTPNGSVWIKKGEEAVIVGELGVNNCLAIVLANDGNEGTWAKTCFRLAPTAPVEASGSERALQDAVDFGVGFLVDGQSVSPERVTVCHGDNSPLRPQPSGECEACKRGEVRHFSTDDGFWVEITTSAGGANEHGLNGWIETLEHYPDGSTKRREYVATDSLALSTTPARAEAQNEGAAVEQTDNAFKIASDLHAAYEQLIYGLPKYLEAENLTDEENMIREAYITLDVTAHRLAAVSDAHPSPTPAADDDRVRIAVEALEKIKAYRVCKESANIWTGVDRCQAIADEALAALKSEGK